MEEQDPKKVRVIPKFSSFKPPEPPAKSTQTREKGIDRASEKNERKEGDRSGKRRSRSRSRERRHRSRSRERRHRDEREHRKHRERRHENRDDRDRWSRRSRSRSPERKRKRSRSPNQETARATTYTSSAKSIQVSESDKHLYRIDIKGDRNNLIYESNSQYSIPSYYRFGHGCVLGLPRHLRIPFNHDESKGLELRPMVRGDNRSKYREMAAMEGLRKLKVVKQLEGAKALDQGLDFVELSPAESARRRIEASSASEESGHFAFRNLRDPNKLDIPEELESASEEEYDELSGYNDKTARAKNAELARKVQDEPGNAQAWLEFARFQDVLMNSGKGGRKITRAERHSVREIKLDILEKAMQKCADNEDIIEAYMDVGSALWDTETLLGKWEEVIGKHTSNLRLWVDYLNFRQSNFTSFTFTSMKDVFKKCLDVLQGARRTLMGRSVYDEQLRKNEEIIVYILHRALIFLRESGYVENAIAIVQALAELNFARPPSIPEDAHESALLEFEKFWESEVARIGEKNAAGWAAFHSRQGDDDPDIPIGQDSKIHPTEFEADDPFGSWIDAEVELCKPWALPARTIDEVEDEDSFRVVLYDDIKDFLVIFIGESAKQALLNVYLGFCGLPPFHAIASSEMFRLDSYLLNDNTTSLKRLTRFWPEQRSPVKLIGWDGNAPEAPTAVASPFQFPLHNWPLSLESLHAHRRYWFAELSSLRDFDSAEADFVRNSLAVLRTCIDNEDFLCYCLEAENILSPSTIKKTAKSLLKKHKNSMRLYNTYASIEARNGNTAQASMIWSTAVGLARELTKESNRKDESLVWLTWIWTEFTHERYNNCLWLLSSIEGGKIAGTFEDASPSPTTVLRAKRYLEEQEQRLLSQNDIFNAYYFCTLRVIFEYLSSERSITPLLDLPARLINILEAKKLLMPVLHESIVMTQAHLLYHHATTVKVLRLSSIRSILENAIKLFPHNTALLSFYAWNESRARIENRLRDTLDRDVLKEGKESVIGYLFAIWTELRIVATTAGFSSDAVRSLFERAAECRRTMNSVDIWRLYIEFELRVKQPQRAKMVYFRALQACPWSKRLALLAFGTLRSALNNSELRKIFSIITMEKELRVYESPEMEEWLEMAERAQIGRGGEMQRRLMAVQDPDSEDEER